MFFQNIPRVCAPALAAAIMVWSGTAQADISKVMSYQGKLTDGGGASEADEA